MPFSTSTVRRGAGLAVCALVASVVLACSGGGEEEPVTAEQAAAIVAAGLLAEEDLPSATWEAEETDNLTQDDAASEDGLEDPDDLFASTPACQAVSEILQAANEDSTPLADIERAFNNGDGGLVARGVTSNIFVPDPSLDIDEQFDRLSDVFTPDGMRACFEDGFRASLEGEEGVVISGIEVYAPETVAPGGIGLAMDLEAIALIIPIELHLEMHMWPEGPAVGSLMIMEMNSELLRENAGDIVDNAHSRLAAAVEAN